MPDEDPAMTIGHQLRQLGQKKASQRDSSIFCSLAKGVTRSKSKIQLRPSINRAAMQGLPDLGSTKRLETGKTVLVFCDGLSLVERRKPGRGM